MPTTTVTRETMTTGVKEGGRSTVARGRLVVGKCVALVHSPTLATRSTLHPLHTPSAPLSTVHLQVLVFWDRVGMGVCRGGRTTLPAAASGAAARADTSGADHADLLPPRSSSTEAIAGPSPAFAVGVAAGEAHILEGHRALVVLGLLLPRAPRSRRFATASTTWTRSARASWALSSSPLPLWRSVYASSMPAAAAIRQLLREKGDRMLVSEGVTRVSALRTDYGLGRRASLPGKRSSLRAEGEGTRGGARRRRGGE